MATPVFTTRCWLRGAGIGEATARLFVQHGARVVLADVQRERGEALAAELGADWVRGLGGASKAGICSLCSTACPHVTKGRTAQALYVHCDVRREADVEAAVQAAVQHFGGLNCMCNNAGKRRP